MKQYSFKITHALKNPLNIDTFSKFLRFLSLQMLTSVKYDHVLQNK